MLTAKHAAKTCALRARSWPRASGRSPARPYPRPGFRLSSAALPGCNRSGACSLRWPLGGVRSLAVLARSAPPSFAPLAVLPPRLRLARRALGLRRHFFAFPLAVAGGPGRRARPLFHYNRRSRGPYAHSPPSAPVVGPRLRRLALRRPCLGPALPRDSPGAAFPLTRRQCGAVTALPIPPRGYTASRRRPCRAPCPYGTRRWAPA
jgi:hypothetical protein